MTSRLRTSRAAARHRPLRSIVASAGLVMSAAAAGLACPSAAAAALPVVPTWYLATQPSHVFSAAPAVTCIGGSGDCAAIGPASSCAKLVGVVCVAERYFNVAEYSRDRGASWEAVPVPSVQGGLFIDMASVSCAGAGKGRTDCAAWAMLTDQVGAAPTEQAAYFSGDGGATWSVASPPAPVGQDVWQAPLVACYELNLRVDCVGAPNSQGAEYSTDGGASWASSSYHQSPSFGDLAAQDVSCALSQGHMDCVAVGYVFDTITGTPVDTIWYSTDGGMIWAPSSLTQREGELNAASCVAVKAHVRCTALGSETYKGITANVALYSMDAGTSWSRSAFPAHTLLPSPWGNVSCATSGAQVDCAAWGSTLLFSANGGATWLRATGPKKAGGDIVCLSSSPGPSCYIVGARAAYSSDGGMTWSASKVAKGFAVQDSMLRDNVACASPSQCVAAGPRQLFTTNRPISAG